MKILSTLVLLFTPFLLFSQSDTLFLTDENHIVGTVNKITSDSIHLTSEGGRHYRLKHEDVVKLVYRDGTTESFFYSSEEKFIHNQKYEVNFGRHLISMNLLTLFLVEELEVGYEYFTKSGYYSYYFYGIYSKYISSLQRSLSFGVDFNYYMTGQGRLRYLMGVGLESGMYKKNDDNDLYIYAKGNNGVLFQLTPKINISALFDIGLRNDLEREKLFLFSSLRINMGYRF